MNIDDFRYITTIADLGSFTGAAQKLFIAQPSLSQRVKYIEKTYGISIFSRNAKGVQLTDEGAVFVKYAQAILNSENDLRREISDMHSFDNRVLRIGTTQFIRSWFFDALIKRFYMEHPNVQLEISDGSSAEQQEMLQSGKTDIAVCYMPVVSKDLKYEVVFEDNYVLVPAKDGTLKERIESGGLENEPIPVPFLQDEVFAAAPAGTRLNEYVMGLQEKYNTQIDIQHYVKNYSMLYAIAETGMASTILYESFFDPAKTYMPYYYLDDESSELQVAVMWRKGAYLQQEAKELIRLAKEINASPMR